MGRVLILGQNKRVNSIREFEEILKKRECIEELIRLAASGSLRSFFEGWKRLYCSPYGVDTIN